MQSRDKKQLQSWHSWALEAMPPLAAGSGAGASRLRRHSSLCQPHSPFTPRSPAWFSLSKETQPQLNQSSSLSSPGGCQGSAGGSSKCSSHDIGWTLILSPLPMCFPRKKEEVSTCRDKLNKCTFIIDPLFPLVSSFFASQWDSAHSTLFI